MNEGYGLGMLLFGLYLAGFAVGISSNVVVSSATGGLMFVVSMLMVLVGSAQVGL